MRVYLDSSALAKRVLTEELDAAALVDAIDRYVESGAVLVSSTLAWVEVARAVRARFDARLDDIADDVDEALNGVAEHDVDREVVSLARRISPNALRSLDAIHVAAAMLLDADVVITYDDRMAEAARLNGLRVAAPGR